jgi:hypothetical protein
LCLELNAFCQKEGFFISLLLITRIVSIPSRGEVCACEPIVLPGVVRIAFVYDTCVLACICVLVVLPHPSVVGDKRASLSKELIQNRKILFHVIQMFHLQV